MSNRRIAKSIKFKFGGYVSIVTCALLGLLLASCSIFDDDEGQDEYEWIGKWEAIEEDWDHLYFKLTEEVLYVASEWEDGEYSCSTGMFKILEIDENIVKAIHEDEEHTFLIEVRLEVTGDELLEWTFLDFSVDGESAEEPIGEKITLSSTDQLPFDVNNCKVTLD